MFDTRILGILAAACLMAGTAGAQVAQTGTDDSSLLEQVKQQASKGQDAQTVAEVSKYVDSNHDIISAILKGYLSYIGKIQAMMTNNETGTPDAPQPAVSGTEATTTQQPVAQARTTDVQPSGPLKTGHLAGYPSLPAVDPASSVINPTAAQLDYAAKVQKEMQARKQYLMAHPEGYTY